MLGIYVFISVGVSFICSMMEAVLLSISPSYILAAESSGKSYAKQLRKYASDKDLAISAILTLNTFAHTLGAAGVGSESLKIFSKMGFADGKIEFYLSLVSLVLTLTILYLSEIIPKSLGHRYWKALTPFILKLFPPLIFFLYPILIASKALIKMFSKDSKDQMSREEVESMIELGVRANALVADEGKFLKNILMGSRLTIEDIMTPARKVFMVPADSTPESIYQKGIPVTRLPVFGKNVNNIIGYVHKEDIKDQLIAQKENKQISDYDGLVRPVFIENQQTPLRIMFNKFIKNKEHIAMVSDKYGTILGVVTLEDLVETFFGVEIMDEFDQIEDLQEEARNEVFVDSRKNSTHS